MIGNLRYDQNDAEGFPQDKEIVSAQVLFPDRKTLDEVIAELRKEIERLKGESSQGTE